ncbi:MAG: hypothetical protein WKH64_14245, partial [Chloroflexia bacterium]
LVSTSSAQGPGGVTLELTLYGEVPAGHRFSVIRPIGADVGVGEGFCGGENCVGNGTVYRAQIPARAGTTIEYHYERVTASGEFDFFHSGSVVVQAGTTVRAYYNFPTVGDEQTGGAGGRAPEGMPNTGAGGMSDGALPAAPVAATVSLLLGGLLLIRRRIA